MIKTVVVKALSNTRGPAPVAQQLYEETEVSIARRELIASQRKLHNLARPDHRPSKRIVDRLIGLNRTMINTGRMVMNKNVELCRTHTDNT